MDPVTAIANALGGLFGVITGAQAIKQEQYEQLPGYIDWSELVKEKQDTTTPIALGIVGLVIVILIVAIVIILIRKK